MIEVENSENEKSFETLNDMMILLESSIYDVQIMVAQTVTALMEVMGISSVDIFCTVPMIIEGNSIVLELKELFFSEEEDIYQVKTEDGNVLSWQELDVMVQFEVVLQVHQKYVSDHQLMKINEPEEIH